MKIKIKRFDKELPLPEYKSKGAAAMDLYARETVEILPHQVAYIPLNVAIEIPEDAWTLIVPRSSTHKLGIMMANGIAVGDSDFCGDNDEWVFPALNFSDKSVVIERGIRIAQMIVLSRETMEIVEVDKMDKPTRGKFGSTGKN